MKAKVKRLTQKELLFAEGILRGETQLKSAMDAGYSAKNLKKKASDMAKRPHIRAYLDKRNEREIITTDEILTGIKDIALNEGEKASDRLRAYELLGKNKKLFTEKTETEHSGGMTIEVAYVDGDD